MPLISTLDTLEDYLSEYQYLIGSFNKIYLLLVRFKLIYGQEGAELLLNDLLRGGPESKHPEPTNQTTTRQRTK